MSDQIVRCTGKRAEFRLVLVNASQTAREICGAHEAKGQAAELLAQTLCGSLLLAAGLKEPGAIQVALQYAGDLTMVTSDATPLGFVRGMIPRAQLQQLTGAQLNLSEGEVRVSQWSEAGSLLRESRVPMVSIHPGKALAGYLLQSQQIASSIGLYAPVINGQQMAVGFLMEALPKIDDDTLTSLEQSICELPSIESFFIDGEWDLDALGQAVAGNFEIETHRKFDVQAFCPCTIERARGSVKYLSENDLREMIAEAKPTEIFCDYCRRSYQISVDTLKEILGNKKN